MSDSVAIAKWGPEPVEMKRAYRLWQVLYALCLLLCVVIAFVKPFGEAYSFHILLFFFIVLPWITQVFDPVKSAQRSLLVDLRGRLGEEECVCVDIEVFLRGMRIGQDSGYLRFDRSRVLFDGLETTFALSPEWKVHERIEGIVSSRRVRSFAIDPTEGYVLVQLRDDPEGECWQDQVESFERIINGQAVGLCLWPVIHPPRDFQMRGDYTQASSISYMVAMLIICAFLAFRLFQSGFTVGGLFGIAFFFAGALFYAGLATERKRAYRRYLKRSLAPTAVAPQDQVGTK